jgi:peroxiredoxin
MKKIPVLVIVALLALSFSYNHADKCVKAGGDSVKSINGNINGINKGTVILTYIVGSTVYTDTSLISHGTFSFKRNIPEPQEVLLSFYNTGYNGTINFFVGNSDIRIEADTARLDQPVIKGSLAQDEFEDYQKSVSSIEVKSANLRMAGTNIYLSGKMTETIRDSLFKINDGLDSEKAVIIIAFVKAHSASVVSAWAICKNLLFEPKLDVLEPLFNTLSPSVQSGIYGKQINNAITLVKATGIGEPAIDFTQPDVNGVPVSLSSFKGKYVLVDFWASWCGPCRAENPNVVKAFNKYKNAGFDILGVSLDNDKAAWLKAIEKDHLTWTHVSDLKGWENAAAVAYGIKGIPFNVLLDKKGIIIAKNLRGADLEKKLGKIFSN